MLESLATINGHKITDSSTLHTILALDSLLSDRLLHRVGQAGDLIAGLSLKAGNPMGQFAVSLFQMLDHLSLVLVQPVLKPVKERGTVARVSTTGRSL